MISRCFGAKNRKYSLILDYHLRIRDHIKMIVSAVQNTQEVTTESIDAVLAEAESRDPYIWNLMKECSQFAQYSEAQELSSSQIATKIV